MTGWVEKDSVSVGRWLVGGSRRSQTDGLGLRLIEVVDCKIKMHLLWNMSIRPARSLVVLHLHGGEPHRVGLDCDEGVARECDLSAEELGPERRKRTRRRAVQRDRSEPSGGHPGNHNHRSHEWRRHLGIRGIAQRR